jgi:hypothetical protein
MAFSESSLRIQDSPGHSAMFIGYLLCPVLHRFWETRVNMTEAYCKPSIVYNLRRTSDRTDDFIKNELLIIEGKLCRKEHQDVGLSCGRGG